MRNGVVSDEQVRAGLEYQARHGCRLGEALVALDLCAEGDIIRTLAQQDEIRFVDLEKTPPAPSALKMIPPDIAERLSIVPVRMEGGRNARLLVAASDPYDLGIDDVVWQIARVPVIVAAAAPSQVRVALARYEAMAAAPEAGLETGSGTREGEAAAELVAASELPSVVRKVNALMADGVRRRATEMYFEPLSDGLRVRCRIDGHLHTLTTLPRLERDAVLARLQVMNGVIPLRSPITTSGRCRARVDGRRVELLLGVTPSAEGPLLVLRVRQPEEDALELHDLGLSPEGLDVLRSALATRSGLVLVSGPTGAGCPTTLNAMAWSLLRSGMQVLSLEDTFERRVRGLNQVKCMDNRTRSLADALEHCLEANPDAVVMGELADAETAQIACRAAASGTLIVAGSHAPDAVTAVTRLLALAPPQVAVAPLSLVLSQRLVRRICPACAKEKAPEFRLERVLRSIFDWTPEATFRRGKGCAECGGLGMRGRTGVFEALPVNEDLRALLMWGATPSVVRESLQAAAHEGIEQAAFARILQGEVDAEELTGLGLRVGVAMEVLLGAEMDAAGVEESGPIELGFEDYAESSEIEIETWDDVKNMVTALA